MTIFNLELSTILLAFLLALSSSTDNFAVGMSVAFANSPLSRKTNAIISLFNALGALVSAGFGAFLGAFAPILAPLGAGIVFGWLAWDELRSWKEGEDISPLARSASEGLVMKLAIPMTLNNLAGGTASGVAGIPPFLAGITALIASYLMMSGGHFVGGRVGNHIKRGLDPRILAAGILILMAVLQFVGVVEGVMGEGEGEEPFVVVHEVDVSQ